MCEYYDLMKLATNALRILALSWMTLAVMASGVSGLVLCIGADGHVALEMAHEGRCQDTGDAHGHRHASGLALLSTVDSGSCVDVPLSSDDMSQPMTEVRHPLTSPNCLAHVFSAATAEAVIDMVADPGPSQIYPGAAMRASPALLSQRTIVLRI